MKRFVTIIITIITFTNCSVKREIYSNMTTHRWETVDAFKEIITLANLDGAILIYDTDKDLFYSNDFVKAKKGQLPASTFKIINSLIAFETGVVRNDSTVIKWDGEKRYLKVWEQDLLFRDAFKYSCVPCYQKIAREIGVERMNHYVKEAHYGKMDINESTIDHFWLNGKSRITPFQQIALLRKLYDSQLPFSSRSQSLVRQIMVMQKNEEIVLSGKTGWSIDNNHNNGWFVGRLKTTDNTYFFAVNVSPDDRYDIKNFSTDRKKITFAAFQAKGIINKDML
ncbi:class D beta-lactamase [Halosquirtibacter xylanolyticus]|uniref:class D beta-lactamase n=1 Tax=Halosquirtibacter xylanolyticus TaxID=3374599 RepID=UPI00374A22F4|nr:class D beta-lactamase [Prolixibacteraceae bacterium]